jgi:hypothetical protein
VRYLVPFLAAPISILSSGIEEKGEEEPATMSY